MNKYQNASQCHSVYYDAVTDSLVYVCPHIVQVYNASSNNSQKYFNIEMSYSTTNNFSFAIICSNILIVAKQTTIAFYYTNSSWPLIS